MPSPVVYLASSSPRRQMLLTQAGIKIKVISPEVDERVIRGESAREMVLRLSVEKAEVALKRIKKRPAIIIAADTCVVAPGRGKVLGKPTHRPDAEKMLKTIQGREHTVLTGYCLLLVEKGESIREIARVVQSKVQMRKMSQDEIRWYVRTGEPMDKAGSYAAQGIGMAFIQSFKGSYSNVVGLPLCEVMQDLRDLGIRWS